MSEEILLAGILESVRFEDLPISWFDFDLKTFSDRWNLFEFQQDALRNIIKCLYLYYYKDKGEKLEFIKRYKNIGLNDDVIHYKITPNMDPMLLSIINDRYPVKDDRILFENFINRASFWMATGSGKTLIIIKLIEILKKLMKNGEIPKKEILLLTHRDDLLNQLYDTVKEFNKKSVERDFKIVLKNLREYETVKRQNQLPGYNSFSVFYYRSDLFLDDQKENKIDFRNYENNGNWYVLLDEAHKGDKEDSKRQMYFSMISRNGFLFNFSATFVQEWDFITTVFYYTLKDFIQKGHGKHLYLFQHSIQKFRQIQNEFDNRTKQKIVLKSLILLTYLKKRARAIKSQLNIESLTSFYHEPLMITLVNTVNLKSSSSFNEAIKSDLRLFFEEIEKIARGNLEEGIFSEALNDLLFEFNMDEGPNKKNAFLLYEDSKLDVDESIKKIKLKDILEIIYNADKPGNIEVLIIPKTQREVAFKLKTSDRPFALIKIGNAVDWIKENLKNYEINESHQDTSIFEQLEDKEEINLLLGSRAFYEGWDSNRPNIIMYINLGTSKEAKKFVLQSVGRGIRIEPLQDQRKRLRALHAIKNDKGLYKKIGDIVKPIETLFVLGSNRNTLQQIFDVLKVEKRISKPQELNEKISNKEDDQTLKKRFSEKFLIKKEHMELISRYFKEVDERIILVYHQINPELLNKIKNSFNEPEKHYKIIEHADYSSFDNLIVRISRHYDQKK
ncbi:MAG: DEAD/DEAH box helicase [Candidatus Lokiarchaeota archaeon]|nr:DEAD/DEAH box helicase [Candidatus Lokiarchaeota archaeon]